MACNELSRNLTDVMGVISKAGRKFSAKLIVFVFVDEPSLASSAFAFRVHAVKKAHASEIVTLAAAMLL